ncbi:hypothetical protein G6F50_016024 [Rhizopus delemar]|uniref:Uncharacterized protein n=1 Tax=Rhizopus delemar TaxID=936053 RepID=A0A9P6XV27_9FUNG|nr:hypothetical protein G6F50_016024 [Rhizopus delemar]
MAVSPADPSSIVDPSGADRTTVCAPSMPLAPGLFSTTTPCGISLRRRSASRRPMPSTPPPAANGTIKLTGRPTSAAWTEGSGARAVAARAAAASNRMGGMVCLLIGLTGWRPGFYLIAFYRCNMQNWQLWKTPMPCCATPASR